MPAVMYVCKYTLSKIKHNILITMHSFLNLMWRIIITICIFMNVKVIDISYWTFCVRFVLFYYKLLLLVLLSHVRVVFDFQCPFQQVMVEAKYRNLKVYNTAFYGWNFSATTTCRLQLWFCKYVFPGRLWEQLVGFPFPYTCWWSIGVVFVLNILTRSFD